MQGASRSCVTDEVLCVAVALASLAFTDHVPANGLTTPRPVGGSHTRGHLPLVSCTHQRWFLASLDPLWGL